MSCFNIFIFFHFVGHEKWGFWKIYIRSYSQSEKYYLSVECAMARTFEPNCTFSSCVVDEFSSCEVRLLVKRGMIVTAAPNRSVTVECPVHHCGKTLNVSWCKVLPSDECEPIPEHEEISQRSQPSGDKLISSLSFKHISTHDDGLYRCELKGHNHYEHSHLINISVSGWCIILLIQCRTWNFWWWF